MMDFPLEPFKNIRTPFFYYDVELLQRTLDEVKRTSGKYGYHVHYALKANANDKLLRQIEQNGFGADCVSGNEVKKAAECGFASDRIVFAGVGKSDEEINVSLEEDIFCFNSESAEEIKVIDELAGKKGTKARIALRINPNVSAHTHQYIQTGLEENKFGINLWELDEVLELLKKSKNVELIGLHFHIGSQITDLSNFKNLCTRVNEIQDLLAEKHVRVEHVNVGGGLGVDYEHPDENAIPDFEAFFGVFDQFLELRPEQQLHFELGRAIIAQCGNLISRVLYVKKGVETNFAIVDAGMTELIRPALYQALHKVENISSSNGPMVKYDVVGPICESSDCFGKALMLPELKRHDLVAIRTAGAYGEVMSSFYNLREKAAAIYSDEIK